MGVRVSELVLACGRLHIDVSPVGSTRRAEVERIVQAGGRLADVGQLGTEPWTVMQDRKGMSSACWIRRSRPRRENALGFELSARDKIDHHAAMPCDVL